MFLKIEENRELTGLEVQTALQKLEAQYFSARTTKSFQPIGDHHPTTLLFYLDKYQGCVGSLF